MIIYFLLLSACLCANISLKWLDEHLKCLCVGIDRRVVLVDDWCEMLVILENLLV